MSSTKHFYYLESVILFLAISKAKYVTIPTNGSLGDRIYKFYEYMLPKYSNVYFRLVLSIEGIGEKHDQLRDVPGSFEKIKNSFKLKNVLNKFFIVDFLSIFLKS